jgi:DNA-binding winged helix-turn-helix (wHTH) protein
MATDDSANRRSIGRYVIDLTRGTVLLDGREIVMRPQTFDVLRFLVDHPTRVIPKEELIAGAWPDVVAGAETLDESVNELRRALGDSDAKLVVSVPGQGYRFDPGVAPGERRNAPGLHLLRWRWVYGLIAPLALAITAIVVWFVTSRL